LNKNLRASIAEYEREKVGQRLRRGKERQARAGYVVAGPPPFGYKHVKYASGVKIEIDESKAAIVRLIFEVFIQTQNVTEVIRYLERNGLPTSRGCNTWQISAVKFILHFAVYTGKRTTHNQDAGATTWDCPAIISKEIYISTGSACHADSIEISSVLKAMNINLATAAGTVRISTGKYTTAEEIETAVKIISDAVKKLSK